jgi:hypothetical protein
MDDARLIEQNFSVEKGGSVKFHAISGNTIVFDSISSKADVERRNVTGLTNLSKINDKSRRFDSDFSVAVSGSVTAVLNADTVKDYRVLDKYSKNAVISPSDKRPEHVKSSVPLEKKRKTYDDVLTDFTHIKRHEHHASSSLIPPRPVNPFASSHNMLDFRPRCAVGGMDVWGNPSSEQHVMTLSDVRLSEEIVSGVRDEGIAISALQDLLNT